jgi:hypothetical protein
MIDKPAEKTDSDAALRAKLPMQEKKQPDPFLQMSTGRLGIGGVTLFALAAVVILGVVLYGLNGNNSGRVSHPAAVRSAVQARAPAAGGKG